MAKVAQRSGIFFQRRRKRNSKKGNIERNEIKLNSIRNNYIIFSSFRIKSFV
jgi:hypothetical protein